MYSQVAWAYNCLDSVRLYLTYTYILQLPQGRETPEDGPANPLSRRQRSLYAPCSSNLNFSWCSRLTRLADIPFMPTGALSQAQSEQVRS